MLISFLFSILIIVAVFLESVVVQYPIVFILLALFFLFKDDLLFFLLALFTAVIFDVITLSNPPMTAFLFAIFLLFLYSFEKIFSALDIRLYMLFVFIAAEIIRTVSDYPFQALQSIIFFILLMSCGIVINKLQIKQNVYLKKLYE